tara:strand:+ start:3153 stop:3506 length:354 start_codon:yes stop_codon:yes gene_type:complete
MTGLFLLAALLSPCQKISLLKEGQSAPCSGDLWPAKLSIKALRCRQVVVPKCETVALANDLVCTAKLSGCERREASANALAAKLSGTSPVGWSGQSVLLSGATGALVGIVAGFLLLR